MSGLEDIPLIGDVAGVAIHGAEAVGDAVTGDWDGAADQAQRMAGGAIGVATDGISTAVEDVYDELAPHVGLPDSHELGHEALQGVGNALGDGVYDLVHGGDDPLGGGDGGFGGAGLGDDPLGGGGDLGGSDLGGGYGGGAMSGGDGGDMGGADMSGGDGSYDMGGDAGGGDVEY
ncbi:hypothetical protein KGA66_13255 [Actinocrinis puniceicyclus]|uniref:Uncharacterized protein n=1 Tax=Actinocrinis puniceicyclus TaxID=977794 RepID=A0A8J7WKK4_9ACTN|nr:hypothetical protein [Actinocrinis puniceicyclus]MBS2964018.1 hypothetical protein [Actinocrinis puniceicyclus]